jgi:hypothetical protein
MNNKVKGWLLELPALLMLVISFIGGIIAHTTGAYRFASTGGFIFFIIVMLAFIAMFLAGKYYDSKIHHF